jgi:hypothetical protein
MICLLGHKLIVSQGASIYVCVCVCSFFFFYHIANFLKAEYIIYSVVLILISNVLSDVYMGMQ